MVKRLEFEAVSSRHPYAGVQILDERWPVWASEPTSFGIDSSSMCLLLVDLRIQFSVSFTFPGRRIHFCFILFASLLDRVIVYFRLAVLFPSCFSDIYCLFSNSIFATPDMPEIKAKYWIEKERGC